MHVLLYTYATCSFCQRAKDLLNERGIEYREESLEGNRAKAARITKAFGRVAMPYVMIDGEPIGGLAELEALLERGDQSTATQKRTDSPRM